MKRQPLRIFMTGSLLSMLAVASGSGQSARELKVHIPFNFAVGQTALAAGDYTLRLVGADHLMIRSADGRRTRLVSTRLVDAGATPAQAKLVFNHYGDQYFLSQLWTAGNRVRYELPKSPIEREWAKSLSKRQTASVRIQQP